MHSVSTTREAHGGTASRLSRPARRARGTAAGRAPAVGRQSVIRWKRRTKRKLTLCGAWTIWESECGRWRVIRSHITLAEGTLPDLYYAQHLTRGTDGREVRFDNIKIHRARRAALLTCEQEARRA